MKIPRFREILKFSCFKLIFPKICISKMFGLEKYFSICFEKIFHVENFYFCMNFSLYQSKNFPGIQKSYLENRAMNLNIRKTGSQTTDPSQRPDATRGWHNGWQPAISCHADTGPWSVGQDPVVLPIGARCIILPTGPNDDPLTWRA